MAQDQWIAAKKPMEVRTIGYGYEEKKVAWHVAEVFLDRPRLGLKTLVVMSLHLNNVQAKKPVAGPSTLAAVLDEAITACRAAGRPTMDIVCGDINMARPPREIKGPFIDTVCFSAPCGRSTRHFAPSGDPRPLQRLRVARHGGFFHLQAIHGRSSGSVWPGTVRNACRTSTMHACARMSIPHRCWKIGQRPLA